MVDRLATWRGRWVNSFVSFNAGVVRRLVEKKHLERGVLPGRDSPEVGWVDLPSLRVIWSRGWRARFMKVNRIKSPASLAENGVSKSPWPVLFLCMYVHMYGVLAQPTDSTTDQRWMYDMHILVNNEPNAVPTESCRYDIHIEHFLSPTRGRELKNQTCLSNVSRRSRGCLYLPSLLVLFSSSGSLHLSF